LIVPASFLYYRSMARRCVVCTNPTEGVTDWIEGIEVPVCVPEQRSVTSDDGELHIPCVVILDNIRKSIESQLGDRPNPAISLELSTLSQILNEMATRFPSFVAAVASGSRDENILAFHWGEKDRCHYLTAVLKQGLEPKVELRKEF